MEDDYAQCEIWDEMYKILSENLEDTIKYLNDASSLEIYYVSSIYDDLSKHFQSEELIKCMEKNATRSCVDCRIDIENAKSVMKTE